MSDESAQDIQPIRREKFKKKKIQHKCRDDIRRTEPFNLFLIRVSKEDDLLIMREY